MMKIASIDAGTNTILLLIAEVSGKHITFISDSYYIPRIGQGVSESGLINPQKEALLFSIIEEIMEKISEAGCDVILSAGTNVYRKARNAEKIINTLKIEKGFELKIISGEEEARLSYLGASYSRPGGYFFVIDIGGGSTEMIYGDNQEIHKRISLPLGVVSLTERFSQKNMCSAEVYEFIFSILNNSAPDFKKIDNTNLCTIAVAGTPTTLAAIKANLESYDETRIEGMKLSVTELSEFADMLDTLSSSEILAKYPVVKGREDVLTAGTVLLHNIITFTGVDSVEVSTRGVRYGLIVDYIQNNYNQPYSSIE